MSHFHPYHISKDNKPQVWYWSADDKFDTEISDARKWVNDYSLFIYKCSIPVFTEVIKQFFCYAFLC